MKRIDEIVQNFGFENFQVFKLNTFHPETAGATLAVSGILGSLACKFEQFMGFEPIIGLVMILLFVMEICTGIKASLNKGEKFELKKLGRAFLKLLVYMIMIGLANLLAMNVKIKPIFGWQFNYYEWIHYTFFNYVIIQLFIGNIQNFNKLGWSEFFPILSKLKEFLKIKEEKKDENER